MKILLINQTFYPDAAATAQHLTDLAQDLVKAGVEVTVLTGRRGYAETNKVYPAREICFGARVIRVWPYSSGRNNKISRILDAFFLNLAFA